MNESASDPAPVEIPVFELPLAILPTELVPLHIFEKRYRRMIEWCSSEEEPFGILLRTDEGARSIGCTATVAEIRERFEDGRLNIAVEGGWRFNTLNRREGADYPLASVRRIDGEGDPDADSSAARAAFTKVLEVTGAEGSPGRPGTSAFEIGAAVDLPVEAKQRLLEAADEQARLDLLATALEELALTLAAAQAVAERARGNGHGPLGPG